MKNSPILAVGPSFLKMPVPGEKCSDIPVVITTGNNPAENIAENAENVGVYFVIEQDTTHISENPLPLRLLVERGALLADCDGDALWLIDQPGSSFRDRRFVSEIREHAVKDLEWGMTESYGRRIEADDKPLLTTVIIDTRGYPLGIAYSSGESLSENFRPKRVRYPDGRLTDELPVLTLRSRRRGIWPKGLKNPNTADKDAPLPDVLDTSSGNFFVCEKIYATREGNALLMRVRPNNGGFCHEHYLLDAADSSFHHYSDDGNAPAGSNAYMSCFHRVIHPKLPA